MNSTIKFVNSAEVQETGTKALIKELGLVGMLRYLEQYDNGGSGDYTKEKYEREDLSIDEIVDLSPDFTIDDIHKLREYNYHVTKDMTVHEKMEYYNAGGRAFLKEIEEERMRRKQESESAKIEDEK